MRAFAEPAGAAAPTRPDTILDGVMGEVVSQVCDANLKRGQEPIDDGEAVLPAELMVLALRALQP